MKKSIIALAVALGASSFAYADGTTLYGSARFGYNYTDNSGWSATNSPANAAVVKGSRVGDVGSRWGIKGSNDLGNGLTASYKFEYRTGSSGFSNRDQWIALGGNFGTIKIGRMYLPYNNPVDYNDIFNNASGGYAVRDAEGIAPGRVNNVLAYVTPDMGGFKATAGIVADGGATNEEHIDWYQLSLEYSANGIYAGLGYAAYEGAVVNTDRNVLNAGLGYENDMFKIGLTAERYDNDAWGSRNPLYYNLAATYKFTPSDKIYASYGRYDFDTSGRKDAVAYGLGYQHDFGKRTRVWAEYGYGDNNNNVVGFDDKASTFSLGLRTDF